MLTGFLFEAQLRCWEARLVSEAHGTDEGFDVLQLASWSLEQVEDQCSESFKLTKGLFLYNEGEIYYRNKDYKNAIESLQSSLEIMEDLLKLDTNVARCYNALGNCYYGNNEPEKALDLYNIALNMRKELSGSEDHYDMPVYKNQIGTVYEDKGKYEEAAKCYIEALDLLKRLKISGNEDEALFLRNLASVYIRQGKYQDAVEPAEKAYHIREQCLGKHPDTVRSIFQQGLIQANLKAFEKALSYFLDAWKMEKSLDAGNHSVVWKLIINGVFDLYKELRKGKTKRNEFTQDALRFCKRFWEEQKRSKKFDFTEYNKEIIDTIRDLLGNKKEDKPERDKYEREAQWFYDGMRKQASHPVDSPKFMQVFLKTKFQVNRKIYFYTSGKIKCVYMPNDKGQAQICKLFLGGKIILKNSVRCSSQILLYHFPTSAIVSCFFKHWKQYGRAVRAWRPRELEFPTGLDSQPCGPQCTSGVP